MVNSLFFPFSLFFSKSRKISCIVQFKYIKLEPIYACCTKYLVSIMFICTYIKSKTCACKNDTDDVYMFYER